MTMTLKIKNILTIIVLLLLTIQGYSQKIRVIKDKDVVKKSPNEEQIGVGYSYFVLNSKKNDDWDYLPKENYDFSNDWIIYENKLRSKKVAYSNVKKDTCVIIQLWNNSLIKSKELYVKGLLTEYEWYCENGQLISKGNYSISKNDTIYYCNGKYKMLYDNFTGETIYYYESGKAMSKGKRDKNNYLRSEGLWIDYDENGKVIWYTFYQYGEQIYSGKDFPNWLREKE